MPIGADKRLCWWPELASAEDLLLAGCKERNIKPPPTCDDAAADLGEPDLPLAQGAGGAPQGTHPPDLGDMLAGRFILTCL